MSACYLLWIYGVIISRSVTNSFMTSQKWTGHFRALGKSVIIELIFDKLALYSQALTKGQDKLVNHLSKHQGL